jgi:hypothetical protein
MTQDAIKEWTEKPEERIEAIKKMALALEEKLWNNAEKLGIKKTRETRERLYKILIEGATLERSEHFLAGGLAFARIARTHAQRIPGPWETLCEGYYYAGVLAEMVGEKPDKEFLRSLYSKQGKNGADKRHAPMRELEDWTLKQYREGSWIGKKDSANKAAHDLKEKVLAQGKIIDPRLAVLTEQNAQRTIAEWIRKSASRQTDIL